MEQKHTPEEVVKGYNSISMIATKQWITKRVYNRLYVSVPIENSTNHHAIAQVYDEEYAELIARAPELLEQVSALTKENEMAVNVLHGYIAREENHQSEIKALTEQVKSERNKTIEEAIKLIDTEFEHISKDYNELRPLDQDKAKAVISSLNHLKKQFTSLKL